MEGPPDAVALAALGPVFPRQLSGRAARTLNLFDQVRRFSRAPRERQEALLGAQLVHLMRHAKQFSPFWAERLANWTPTRRPLADHLAALPPLTRADLQAPERVAAQFPGRKALHISEGSTSGSTGTPVRFERANLLYVPLYDAVTLLSAVWHGFDPTKTVCVIGNRCTDKEGMPLGPPFQFLGPVGTAYERNTRGRDVAELYDYCAERRPAYLQCGPTQLTALARYAIETGRRDLKPDLALTLGSMITPDIRAMAREGLGAKIVDRYSCEETGHIALQCPKHDHLHVISPMTLVEIVDENAKPCPPGVPGRVLITAMQSYAMPLIRYELGDMAEWGGPCDCGVTLPVFAKLWGRTRHVITTPDGKRTYARIYARDFADIAGLKEYRFVLHRNEAVVAQLRVVEPSETIARQVTEKVQHALGYPYPVHIRYVDQIDWGSSWKQDYFGVSDAPP